MPHAGAGPSGRRGQVDGVGEVLLAGLGVDADGSGGAEQLGDGDDFDPRAG